MVASEREQRRLAELLELAQQVGRLGVWERDIPSGAGRWDREVFRLYGLEANEGTPDFETAMQRVHPDDRVRSVYEESTRQAGPYSYRYRIVLPDGRMRRVHSVWRVANSPAGVPDRAVGILVDDTESAQLAESFNEASAQLQLAVELGDIAIWRHDLKTDRMHYNLKAYEVLAIAPRPDGMALAEVRALIHPDDLPRVIESARIALQNVRPTDMEARYRRADGCWRHVLTRRVVERAKNGEALAFIGVALDVTEQVESRQQALELARRLEITTEAAGVGVWTFDLATRHVEWNAHVWRLSGLAPGSPALTPAQWVERVVHPEDRDRVRADSIDWVRSKSPAFDTELRLLHPDGQVRWVVNRGRVDARPGGKVLFGFILDVTERRVAQDALRQADQRAALAARGAGIGTWEVGPNGECGAWDEQMCRLRGLEPGQPLPRPAAQLASIHPDDREGVLAMFDSAATHRWPSSCEYRVQWPDGSWHWLAARAMPVSGAAGSLRGRAIGVSWDITEAKEAEAAHRAKEYALRASRAKSQFLARMSHELRTPLNAVLGFTQLLQAEEDGSAPARSARLEHIRSGGEHLLSLINDVLDLSSLESEQLKLDIEPVSLSEAVREALVMVEGMARERGVTVEAGALEGEVLVDRVRLRQVLINLLSNASKYNRPQGRVSVRASNYGTRVVLRVADTGRGMSDEQLSHLFEPFNRFGVEREGIEGTGIGLMIAKVIVERMGGEISVSSQPDKGSRFEVRLKSPHATTDPMRLSASVPLDTAVPAPRLRSGRLLYIEDNPVNTLLVQELVAQRAGLSLACEADGESGVARAAALLPDLILVDMQLPDMDGHEVLRRLRAEAATVSIPCIALSANVMPQDIERALANGFSDYWTKPIDLKAFMAALDALFAGR